MPSSRGRGRGSVVSNAGHGRGQVSVAHATTSYSSTFPELTQDQWKTLHQLFAEKSSGGNVLFMPSLNCTLISISKILKQTKCVAFFTDILCVLQDHFS